jgi:excisionase family DNA binding protein
VTEAAERLGRNRSIVLKMIHDGRLEARKVGPVWAIPEPALTAFAKIERPTGPANPKLRDERVLQKLERLFEGGATIVEALRAVGSDQARYYLQRRNDPAFAARMDAARAKGVSRRQ